MAGRLLPPRHRLAGGGAGEGGIVNTRHSGRRATAQSSYAGLTRVSITLQKTFSKRMDCRVKPGNDVSSRLRSTANRRPRPSAVVPCSRNALMTLRPTFHLCTSSGPSTSRCERTCVYHLARMRILAEAERAVQLDRGVDHVVHHVRQIHFRDRIFLGQVHALFRLVGDVQQHQAADVELAGAFGEHELHGLAVGQQHAEGRALGHMRLAAMSSARCALAMLCMPWRKRP